MRREASSIRRRTLRFICLTLATVVILTRPQRLSACGDCGCSLVDGAICTRHTHDDGSSHSHDSSPTVSSGAGTGGGGSYYQWDVPTTPDPGTMRFTVLGDTQGLTALDQLVVDMNAYNSEFFILPGDLVSTGGSGSWDNWIAKANNFNGERYMVPGNHDLPVGGDALWQSKFSWLPDSQLVGGQQGIDKMDYYFDKGDTRFISVTTDSEANGAGGQPAALAWLDAVLNDPVTQAKEHVFVYSHHPVTYQNLSGTGGTAGQWWQTMANSGVVDALFAGHWHLYQPSQPDPNSPTWEATLGTGGGSLEGFTWQYQHGYTLIDVTGPRVEATFFGDADGDGAFDDIMDQFVINDSSPTPTGLVAYYGFNYGNSNLDLATSVLAKQHHGAFVADATTSSGGVLGKALSVDGVGDYAHGGSIGDYTLSILGDLTISLHANFDSLSTGANQNTLVAYSGRIPTIGGGGVYGPQESTNHPYHLSIRDDNRLQIMWEHDNATQVVLTSTDATSANAGQWRHYMVVRDTQNMEVRFYVDGVQLGSSIPFNQLPTGGGNGFLHIGNGIDGDTGFDGSIDELTIYTEVLLPGQIFVGPTPGDLDGDHDVDIEDFVNNFLPNFGEILASSGSAATLAMGDLDVDGDVDLFDFDAFQGAYLDANPGASPLSFTIPEPTTVLLSVIGSIGLWIRRQRLPDSHSTQRLFRTSVNHSSRAFPLFLAAAVLIAGSNLSNAASLIHDYQLVGDFRDSLGGPDLLSGGGNLGTNGYFFEQNTGLSLSSWDPTGQGDDYAIEMYLTIDNETMALSDYQKMIDFKNRSSDNGFYLVDRSLPDYRLTFFGASVGNGIDTFFPDTFHHLVLSRDSSGGGTLSAWLDGQLQWSSAADVNSVADAADNILYFLRDEGLQFHENPAGYVDFIRIYDDGVTQGEVDTMVAGLPNYSALEVNINKLTGMVTVQNNFPEPLEMRGYQLTSATGTLSDASWSSWDANGLDGDTWYEANPSSTQLAELNLTSSASFASSDSRSLGAAYSGGLTGAEDLIFEYLAPNDPNSIAIPVTYSQPLFAAGDFDLDGDVDGFDFFKWQRGESPSPFSASDLADWETNFGFVSGSSTAAVLAVPELSSLMSMGLGSIALLLWRQSVIAS